MQPLSKNCDNGTLRSLCFLWTVESTLVGNIGGNFWQDGKFHNFFGHMSHMKWFFRGSIQNSNMASQWDFSSCLLWRRIKTFEWKFLSVKILIQIESVIFLIGSVFNSMLIINLLRNKHKLVTKSHVYALNFGSRSFKLVTSMWAMDVGPTLLEAKRVGDKFEMLATDIMHWENQSPS